MIVRQLIHIKRVPGVLIPGLHVAGENAIPEIDLMQLSALRIIAPNDTDVEHIEMIIGKPVHATVIVVMTVRDNHPDDVVLVLRLDPVLNVLKRDIKWTLARRRLCRLVHNFGHIVDILGQIVPVPERNE